jgi:hypothetical protein
MTPEEPVPNSSPITRIRERIEAGLEQYFTARRAYNAADEQYFDGLTDGLEAALVEIIDGTCTP